jgi:hypothetical protein
MSGTYSVVLFKDPISMSEYEESNIRKISG